VRDRKIELRCYASFDFLARDGQQEEDGWTFTLIRLGGFCCTCEKHLSTKKLKSILSST